MPCERRAALPEGWEVEEGVQRTLVTCAGIGPVWIPWANSAVRGCKWWKSVPHLSASILILKGTREK